MTAGKPVDEQREATSTDNGVDVNCAKAKHRTLADLFIRRRPAGNGLYPSSAAPTALSIRTRCPEKGPATESNLSISPENDLAQIVQKQVSIWKFFQ